MESTKHKLPEDVQIFLNNLKQYLDTPLYFYGSVQRDDYFNGSSDVDIDIFTDNEKSIIEKLSHYFKMSKTDFTKTITKYNNDTKVVYGHKVMYKSEELSLPIEFSVYNEKYKQTVLYQNNSKTTLPTVISWLLIALKYSFYKLHVIDGPTYTYIKKHLLSTFIGRKEDIFIKIN